MGRRASQCKALAGRKKHINLTALTKSNLYEGLWCLDGETSTQSRPYSNTTAFQSNTLPWDSLLNCLSNQLWCSAFSTRWRSCLHHIQKETADHGQKVTPAFHFMKYNDSYWFFFFILWEKCKVLIRYNQTDANCICVFLRCQWYHIFPSCFSP